jgi:GNAT superfamily N-acetyltransferase
MHTPANSASPTPAAAPAHPGILVTPLDALDLAEAKRIFHLAFGTFLGLPDPTQFFPDRDFVISRWRTDASGALAAKCEGRVVGSNLAVRWGSAGFFGPLTVHPEFWKCGVASRLMESTMRLFEASGSRLVGLFTFAHSTQHLHLYQKFGFWPRFLTPILSLSVRPAAVAPGSQTYSELSQDQRDEVLKASFELTDAIYEGLDVRREILAVAQQGLGDTVFLWDHSRLAGLAICHGGPDTEAGNGTAYVKFAAARTATAFQHLLAACEGFAATRGLTRLEAGVNMARDDAYQRMIAHGFRTEIVGVAMHRANDPGYSRPDVYVADDWR